MNRRDYVAHTEWSDGIRAEKMRHANRHAVKPAPSKPRRQPQRWRAMLASVAGVIR